MQTKVRWAARDRQQPQSSENQPLHRQHTSYASTNPTQPTVPAVEPEESNGPTCPKCENRISSTITRRLTTAQHLIALLLCSFGCWLGSCIPYIIGGCKDDFYFCPHCEKYLETWRCHSSRNGSK